MHSFLNLLMSYTVPIYLRGKPTVREYLLKWSVLRVNHCWPNPLLAGIIQCSFAEANGPVLNNTGEEQSILCLILNNILCRTLHFAHVINICNKYLSIIVNHLQLPIQQVAQREC